ncbi:MAG: BlaI/MecI/CopY family transcriptional regulator [Candidatus Rokubacteria bacterium]|nr:BlaI/MecI/CopY family transcriptional regulator [Candidatus Rokubacteria bacterium]MBI2555469.1 BlaI/MecI/CopY family transcriptional regulator [Candidatus Rokubacteria bacterium]
MVPTVFRPSEKGLRKVFGDLEADVMELVWQRGSVTVADVWQALRRERELAYTTVKTVMSRLAEKGYLKRSTKERAHTYEPTMGRDAFLRAVSEEVLEGLFVDFGEPIRAHLVKALRERDLPGLERLEALVRGERRRRK